MLGIQSDDQSATNMHFEDLIDPLIVNGTEMCFGIGLLCTKLCQKIEI